MLNPYLMPGDKYDARCAEVFITEKGLLIYHCSLCEEIYTTFNELLSHITKDHYRNTKELHKESIKSVETVIKQETNKENQYAKKKLFVRTRKRVDIEKKLSVEKKGGEFLTETVEVKAPLEEMATNLRPTKKLTKQRKFRTNSCKNYFLQKTKIVTARHQDNSKDERKYICAVCGFAFKEKYNLRSHLLRHSNQKNFMCSICAKKFLTKAELRFHEYSHKSELCYMCDYCGMGFLKSSSLTQHIKKCNKCLEPFSNFYQRKDYALLLPKVSTEISLFNSEQTVKIQENFHNCGKSYPVPTKIIQSKVNDSRKQTKANKVEEHLFDGEFFLEQNLDEYELVQTLSDLECNKYV